VVAGDWRCLVCTAYRMLFVELNIAACSTYGDRGLGTGVKEFTWET
jgi:hypothetical protein